MQLVQILSVPCFGSLGNGEGLGRQLVENEPTSKLCDELGLQPTVFYRWQKEFFENGAAAFEQKVRPNFAGGRALRFLAQPSGASPPRRKRSERARKG